MCWLDLQLQPNSSFYVGKRMYKISLLQRRNAELLAVARLNLGLSHAHAGQINETDTAVNLVWSHLSGPLRLFH